MTLCCGVIVTPQVADSFTSIGGWAFYDCYNLTDIYFQGNEEEWNELGIDLNVNVHFVGNDNPPNIENPSITDILNLKKYILGLSMDKTNLDFNTDGNVNILDLTIALNKLTK